MGYKLNENEQRVIMALLVIAQDRKEKLETLVRRGTTTLTIAEFESNLTTLRTPATNKEFISTFIDDIVKNRLDTLNPLKYLDKYATDVQVDKYIFMIDLNIRVLQDLEIKSIKGEEVS